MTTDHLRDQIKTALIDVIGGNAYDCTRVWEAWGVGTMYSDDFVPVIERVDEIADEVCRILDAAEQAEGKQ